MPSENLYLGTNGVNPDRKAEVIERVTLSEQGSYLQLRITSTTGRLTVRGLGVEARVGKRQSGQISSS